MELSLGRKSRVVQEKVWIFKFFVWNFKKCLNFQKWNLKIQGYVEFFKFCLFFKTFSVCLFFFKLSLKNQKFSMKKTKIVVCFFKVSFYNARDWRPNEAPVQFCSFFCSYPGPCLYTKPCIGLYSHGQKSCTSILQFLCTVHGGGKSILLVLQKSPPPSGGVTKKLRKNV